MKKALIKCYRNGKTTIETSDFHFSGENKATKIIVDFSEADQENRYYKYVDIINSKQEAARYGFEKENLVEIELDADINKGGYIYIIPFMLDSKEEDAIKIKFQETSIYVRKLFDIGTNPPKSVKDIILQLDEKKLDKVVKIEEEDVDVLQLILSKANYNDIQKLFKDVSLNQANGVLTFTAFDDSIKEIDLDLELVPVDGSYDAISHEIVIELASGAEIRIPVGDILEDMNSRINDLADNIPTKVSELENDSNFQTEAQVDNKIAAIPQPDIPTKVSELENDSSFISEAPNDGKPYVRKNKSWSEIEIDLSNLENDIELTDGVSEIDKTLLATLTHNGSYNYTNDYKYIYIKEKGGYGWILDTETDEIKRIGEQPEAIANWEQKNLSGKNVYITHIGYNAGTDYKVIPSIKKLFNTQVLVTDSQGVGQFIKDNPGKYLVAINAGKFNISNPNYPVNGAEGVLISDGVIYEELAHPNYHVIAFDELGNANFFKGVNASEILSQGYIGATTGFQPVILNGQKMDGSYISVPGGALSDARRQVICRLTNGDYKVYSFDTGVTFEVSRDIIYDNEPDIDFAYQLDGGGSTTTYVKDTPVFVVENFPFGRRVLDAIVWELKDLPKESTFKIDGNTIKYIGNKELQLIGVNHGILSKLDEIDQNISNLDFRIDKKIDEAPIDNKIYARWNGMWVEVSSDAPEPTQEFIKVRNYGSSDTLVTYDTSGMSVIPELSQTQEGTIITYTNTLDTVYPFNQIEDWTDEFGNKFVKIPPIWIKIYTGEDGETTGYDLSNKPFGGAELHPIFKNVETGEPQPYYFGKYTAALEGDKLISKAGKDTLKGSTLIGTFRTYASNNGLGYHQISLHGWTLIRYLMVAYFGTTNVLSMFPAPTVQFPLTSGTMDTYKTAFNSYSNANVFFGIENLVYDTTTLVDGVLEHQGEVYEESDFRNWVDNYINYTLVGQTPPENGLYITKMKYVNGIEFPIDVTGGSSSTYFTDGTDGGHNDTRIIITGVEHSHVSNHLRGLYFWRRTYGTTGMSSVTGSRLMYSKVGE